MDGNKVIKVSPNKNQIEVIDIKNNFTTLCMHGGTPLPDGRGQPILYFFCKKT
jgi:hypothetical protein